MFKSIGIETLRAFVVNPSLKRLEQAQSAHVWGSNPSLEYSSPLNTIADRNSSNTLTWARNQRRSR
jgi:hypothetical protein